MKMLSLAIALSTVLSATLGANTAQANPARDAIVAAFAAQAKAENPSFAGFLRLLAIPCSTRHIQAANLIHLLVLPATGPHRLPPARHAPEK